MLIQDHINLLGDNPLIGVNDDRIGVRFPDMSDPYTAELIEIAENIAVEEKIKVRKGVYAAVTGPNLETRAEYRYIKSIGADVVGMSTVPEVVTAVHMKMKVLGVSIITDDCFPDALEEATLDGVIATAGKAEPQMTRLIKKVLERL